ncbi:transglutaminase family protein [Roseibacillus ishigakijimensis]|uniref:Transglutaminase family protein n=1 Tax=Roseibacillus ishigakijimensis TaxID=454146 RepID=A0A934VLD1_9BACT|nr:transglutaminase family protein [Roseibacillus ishigakijimensis]MBK1834559.1 transglutaminase family protein [Roseibacillus ishigakijimensis]
MTYTIHHRTTYRYEAKVSYSHHLARLRSHLGQTRLLISPTPDTLNNYLDYFGNATTYFSITTPHQELTIDAHSTISLPESVPTPQLDLSPPWEKVRDTLAHSTLPQDLSAAEFTFSSGISRTSPALLDYALPSFQPGTPILTAARDLTRRIYDDFQFDNSATTVSTPVHDVLEKKAGVCQDFAHLQISCLRSLGLSACYVSGYLRTNPPPGKPRLIGADASHAWVSVYVPQLGWTEFDATNNVIPTTNHIPIARGRDYLDISPVRGTVFGGGRQKLSIGVTVIPEGETAVEPSAA